jgi:hypothetical protein
VVGGERVSVLNHEEIVRQGGVLLVGCELGKPLAALRSSTQDWDNGIMLTTPGLPDERTGSPGDPSSGSWTRAVTPVAGLEGF